MRVGAALAILLLGALASAAQEVAIPHPDLSGADAGVRQQLEIMRTTLDDLLATDAGNPDVRGALGLMGELYLAYDYRNAAKGCFREVLERAPSAFRALYFLGYTYDAEGATEEAIEVLSRAVAVDPADAPARLRLGRVLLAAGDLEAARRQFRSALASDAGCAAASFGLGEAARQEQRYEEAAKHYADALEIYPDSDQARYAYGLTLRQLDRLDEARELLEATDLQRVTASTTTWQGCADPLLQGLRQLATGASPHLTRAALAFFDGDYERELDEYRKAAEADPEEPTAHRGVAASLLRQGRIAEAIPHYRRTVELAPENLAYRNELATTLREAGDLDEAAAVYRGLLEASPDYGDAHQGYARLLIAQERPAEAIEHLLRAVELDPTDQEARIQLAVLLLRENRREEGLRRLAAVLEEMPPADPAQRMQLAAMLLVFGDVAGGERQIRAILELEAPPAVHAEAHGWLGQLAVGRQQRDTAIGHFERALELQPENDAAREALQKLRDRP